MMTGQSNAAAVVVVVAVTYRCRCLLMRILESRFVQIRRRASVRWRVIVIVERRQPIVGFIVLNLLDDVVSAIAGGTVQRVSKVAAAVVAVHV